MSNIIQDCTADPVSIPSDSTTASVITATVIDSDTSNAVDGVTVTWVATGTGSLNATTSVTDNNGKAVVNLTASAAGSINVTATTDDDATGKSATVTAEEVAAGNAVISCSASPTALPYDGSVMSVITAVVADASTTPPIPVPDIEVTFTSDVGELSSPTGTTDADGAATTTLVVSDGVASVVAITATTASDAVGKTARVFANAPLAAADVLNQSDADNHTLDQYDIDFGVTAIIPYFVGAAGGDTVTFYWGSHQLQFEVANPLSELPRVIDVSADMPPAALGDGVYQIYYTVRDEAGNTTASEGITITVKNSGHTSPTLPAPVIPGSEDGYLNIEETIAGLDVTVTYPDMAEGDVITLYWGANDTPQGNPIPAASASFTHTVGAGETSYVEPISAGLFFPSGVPDGGYEGVLHAYYTVIKAGSTGGELLVSNQLPIRVDTLAP